MCNTLDRKFIMCVTGMPGCGKTVVSKEIAKMGLFYVNLGDVVREQTRLRGLELTDESCGQVMVDLRKEHGPYVIAKLSLDKFSSERNRYVVDGIRSIFEVEEYKKVGKTRLLSIHASPERRFGFLEGRGRKDAPMTRREFDIRDKRELDVGVGNAIALADEIISNNSTIENLISQAKQLLKAWMKEDGFA